jgi:outer membrane protein TolC
VRAVYRYREQLDEFKIFLGLPVNAPVTLDPAEVERLREAGLHPVAASRDQVVAIALRRRLDLLTAYDRVVDSERAVALARNGLAPDAQLRLAANVPSKPDTHAARLEFPQGTYSAGLDIDLPLQRKDERNAYREALIGLDRTRRSADELRDEVTFAIRQSWRSLKETERNFRIQTASVALAGRRVAGARELLRLGEATARDLLEANEALVNAQNALTRTLIDHTLARLAIWRDTELLRVGEDGVWQEATDVDQ